MFASFLALLNFIPSERPSFYEVSIFYRNNSPINVFASVALFLFFINFKISSERISSLIQFFAPLTFGVYLIHDNNFVREPLWHQWLQIPLYYDSNYCVIYWGLSVIGVFLLSSLIEWIRKKVIDLFILLIHRLHN